ACPQDESLFLVFAPRSFVTTTLQPGESGGCDARHFYFWVGMGRSCEDAGPRIDLEDPRGGPLRNSDRRINSQIQRVLLAPQMSLTSVRLLEMMLRDRNA